MTTSPFSVRFSPPSLLTVSLIRSIPVRYNSLSRVFEGAFRKEGVPTRILGGQRFFERAEVKDVLAYLQLVDNPAYVPAFSRVVNVPQRGIGQKTVAEILTTAGRKGLSPLEVVERIYEGRMPDIKPPVKRKVADFVLAVKVLRKLALEVCRVICPASARVFCAKSDILLGRFPRQPNPTSPRASAVPRLPPEDPGRCRQPVAERAGADHICERDGGRAGYTDF